MAHHPLMAHARSRMLEFLASHPNAPAPPATLDTCCSNPYYDQGAPQQVDATYTPAYKPTGTVARVKACACVNPAFRTSDQMNGSACSSTGSRSLSNPQDFQAKQLQLQMQQHQQEMEQRREREQRHKQHRMQQETQQKQQRMQQHGAQQKQESQSRKQCWEELRSETYRIQKYQRDQIRAAAAEGVCSPTHKAKEKLLQLREKQQKLQLPPRIKVSELSFGRLIGAGTYGHVHLAKHCKGDTFVVKIQSKAQCLRDRQLENVLSEKSLHSAISLLNHPFLVNMKATSQDDKCLHIVLEYVPGGEFFNFIYEKYPRMFPPERLDSGYFGYRHMKEDHARFYAAQLVLALEILHSHSIAIRDLKPENILMDAEGYIKLTDFGFAKSIDSTDGRTYTFCGSVPFMAPEVLQTKGHGFAADWWSLGCVIYVMLSGYPPFFATSTPKAFERIVAHDFAVPGEWTRDAKDLVCGLMQPDPKMRLGVAGGGVWRLKAHSWFQGYDWDAIAAKRYLAPYVPQLSGAADTSNFGHVNVGEMLHPFQLSAEEQEVFKDF